MDILTTFALQSETQNLFMQNDILYTGVGKVNASYHLTKTITHKRPDVILNIGTAGSKKFNYGNLIICNKFIQRDMNATPFGYNIFETPSDPTPQILDCLQLEGLPPFDGIGICGTGDNFETSLTGGEPYNVVDMEAYALAKIAKMEDIPFICIKFISDGADQNAPENWNESLVIGAKKMKSVFDKLHKYLENYF